MMETIYSSILRIKSLLNFVNQEKDKLAEHPVYVYFLNSELNTVPKFLAKNADIGIVIQKQFKDFSIGNRYLEVVLFFSGEPHVLTIDLLTIFSVEIFNISKYSCEYKKSDEYLAIASKIGYEEYNKNIVETARNMFNLGSNKAPTTSSQSSSLLATKTHDINTVMTNIDEIVKGLSK